MGVIIAKVLRLDSDTLLLRRSRLRRKVPPETEAKKKAGGERVPSLPRPPLSTSIPPLREDSTSSPSPPPPPPSVSPPHSNHSTPTPTARNRIARPPMNDIQTNESFIDFEESVPPVPLPSPAHSTTAPPPEVDLWAFSSEDQEANPSTYGTGDIDIDMSSSSPSLPLPTREQLAAKREAKVDEKVREALEFKQEMDENNRRESDELEAAKQKHDYHLTMWASNNKEKRNVRTLLSTMHTVLWSGHKWKTVSLGDLLEPRQVKLSYRKAMLVVHPDRCSNDTAEIRFIAKRLFEAINEAYQEFLKKEDV
eukprot:CAMPEP_0182420858 /NCGR_PEP_ID=MMETSP1167-20130531/5941_1 /TAXON_ID=2988 /ORGANISM="Mallomonas Sp, Strain CCMP3275" /LENGTH=308 /DNA_ID=CAMNT_0024597363 /DNA_START=275 /DNA_END=1201 /DNA_ORIENTATION=+